MARGGDLAEIVDGRHTLAGARIRENLLESRMLAASGMGTGHQPRRCTLHQFGLGWPGARRTAKSREESPRTSHYARLQPMTKACLGGRSFVLSGRKVAIVRSLKDAFSRCFESMLRKHAFTAAPSMPGGCPRGRGVAVL